MLSVVSMADLAFLIIIFLMITMGLERAPSLEVTLPEAATGQTSAVATAVTIEIDRGGAFAVDGRPVAADALADALRPRLAALAQPTVVVAADHGVDWAAVVHAMDVSRSLGVQQLDLSVRDPQPVGLPAP